MVANSLPRQGSFPSTPARARLAPKLRPASADNLARFSSAVNHARAGRFNGLEFTLVIGIAFGQFIVFSVASLLAGPGTDDRMFDSGHLAYLLVYEAIAGSIVALILWRNGWRLRDFKLQPSLAATGQGVGLACAGWLVYYLAAILAHTAFGGPIGDRVSEDDHLMLGGAAP